MLWSFFQSPGTAAESKQFGDGRTRVNNIFGTLEMMRDVADAEWDCWTPSGARHTIKAQKKKEKKKKKLDRWTKHKIDNKKLRSARKGRRRARPERRRKLKIRRNVTRQECGPAPGSSV